MSANGSLKSTTNICAAIEIMSYKVNWKGVGRGEPDESNPEGIKITASGFIVMEGDRPETNMHIPMEAAERCKAIFMRQCAVVHYQGDSLFETRYPQMWLAKKPKNK